MKPVNPTEFKFPIRINTLNVPWVLFKNRTKIFLSIFKYEQ